MPSIFTVVLAALVALVFIVCQLVCWFTEPRILLGMGRALPAVTIAIAWLTLAASGINRLVGVSSHAGTVSGILFAGTFHFFVLGVCFTAVLLVVECVLLIECGFTRARSGAMWWHVVGATSTVLSLLAVSQCAKSG